MPLGWLTVPVYVATAAPSTNTLALSPESVVAFTDTITTYPPLLQSMSQPQFSLL